MFLKFALLQKTIAVSGIALMVIFSSTYSNFFGLKYDNTKDFSCCKNNQLVVHHYYKFNVLYIPVYDGYTQENVGKPEKSGCDIRCTD